MSGCHWYLLIKHKEGWTQIDRGWRLWSFNFFLFCCVEIFQINSQKSLSFHLYTFYITSLKIWTFSHKITLLLSRLKKLPMVLIIIKYTVHIQIFLIITKMSLLTMYFLESKFKGPHIPCYCYHLKYCLILSGLPSHWFVVLQDVPRSGSVSSWFFFLFLHILNFL